MEKYPVKKTNDHLANERTFLAWVRTAIGIMGFGFVVVKFSMFVRQISIMMGHVAHDDQKGLSSVVGVILVALGALTVLLAYFNYKKIKKRIDADTYNGSSPLITVLTCGIIFISALVIWYLIESMS